MSDYDAIIIGSGPNGLAAAVTLATAGRSVLVLERDQEVGGALQSAPLTLPGFIHDRCSAIHPLAACSPFFSGQPLAEHGAHFIHSPAAFAHPLDDGTAVMCERALEATAQNLGEDAAAYRRVMGPLVGDWDKLMPMLLQPPLRPPRHPLILARFGVSGLQSAARFARRHFQGRRARAIFAGAAAHSILPFDFLGTTAFGLMLMASAHAVGWPMIEGGSHNLAQALASILRKSGGTIQTGVEVRALSNLPTAALVMCDVSPRQLAVMAGDRLPARYRRILDGVRYGPGVFKLDWALAEPIPWRAPECRRAGTVHLGGTLEEIEVSEHAAWHGTHCERPFVLLAQQTLFDPSRAPAGRHTAWAYCHVPNGTERDMTEAIESQVERFAPGFRQTILARSVLSPAAMQAHNPNLIGGGIAGCAQDLRQILARPKFFSPYATPIRGLYLCSASTPPGPGVHGMCGVHAARVALRQHPAG